MKRSTMISIFIFPIFIISTTIALAAGYKTIDSMTLIGMLADPTKEVIVDVRELELYKAKHIPGAINIEYEDAKKNGLDKLPEDKSTRIVFVCHGGPMGDKLSKKLVERGYTNVYNLEGGMRAWFGPTREE